MDSQIITRDDLRLFRFELIKDIQVLLHQQQPLSSKPLLKNSEVKKLLSLSETKIQRLRIRGLLPSTKIGGVHYYRYADIEKLMDHPE